MFPLENIRQALNLRLAITAEMQKAIGVWQNCYVGKAPWLDENVISLRLEQSITREFANITLNEMTVNISNETLSKLFETATEELNSELQSGLATGAMVIKPLGGDRVQYISANAFVPIEFDAKHRLVKVIFPEFKKIGDNYYTRLEYHSLDKDKGLTVTNTAYRSSSSEVLGTEIPLAVIDEWADLPPAVTYPDMKRPAFGYFRVPIKNTIDGSSCGMSILTADLKSFRKPICSSDGLTGNLKAGSVRFMLILPCLRTAKPTDLTGVCTVPLMWIWATKNCSRTFLLRSDSPTLRTA